MLRELYLSLLLKLAALYEERKEFELGIEALERVVAQEPTHEGAYVGLMRLYAPLGRRREALRQYERLRETLLKEFGTEPEVTTTRVQQETWAGTFPPTDSPPADFPAQEVDAPSGAGPKGVASRRHNLPLAHTSFVGRGRESLVIKRLLVMTRLLILTGAGGCGKTRLALEAARDLVGAYPDGVWLAVCITRGGGVRGRVRKYTPPEASEWATWRTSGACGSYSMPGVEARIDIHTGAKHNRTRTVTGEIL
jgi:tetratricopeptide (TPR) repeat protein